METPLWDPARCAFVLWNDTCANCGGTALGAVLLAPSGSLQHPSYVHTAGPQDCLVKGVCFAPQQAARERQRAEQQHAKAERAKREERRSDDEDEEEVHKVGRTRICVNFI